MACCKSENKPASTNTCCGGACVTKNSYKLLTWANPKKSATVLGSILGGLLFVKYVNVVSLFFYFSTFALIISALAEYAGRVVTGTGFVTKYKPLIFSKVPSVGETAEYYAPHVVTITKKVEAEGKKLITSTDIEKTFRAGVATFLLYKITSIFSLWSLLFASSIISFTAPPVYLANKEVIDANVVKYSNCARARLDEGIKVAGEKLAPYTEKAKNAGGPIFKFIESKLPVRTAGSTVKKVPSSATTSTTTDSTPITATTTSSAIHEQSAKKVSTPVVDEPTEVDFNKLGEELKKEAHAAAQNEDAFTREKIDAPPSV
ncbi:uncharacterized protein C5L36_0A11400 [Pichia kudriavzevii]|uniref:Reticulon-like protein n=1 Tax=Pichia kudriavzevii TaxID=4909 RepID=A0A2U9R0A3_PICKU|nr:uncharacterized protein C5L36_0A11400 [Pichia kudriavzevii]AWU74558.1 hypothetical protein C5L36_0A11400 [Pichia kudriavzevii]